MSGRKEKKEEEEKKGKKKKKKKGGGREKEGKKNKNIPHWHTFPHTLSASDNVREYTIFSVQQINTWACQPGWIIICRPKALQFVKSTKPNSARHGTTALQPSSFQDTCFLNIYTYRYLHVTDMLTTRRSWALQFVKSARPKWARQGISLLVRGQV